jgi:hypothetical protein
MVRSNFIGFQCLFIFISLVLNISCNYMTSSPFPSYLSQVAASRDLSKYVGKAEIDRHNSRLSVLDNGTNRYVFIMLDRQMDVPLLIILDDALKVKKTLEDVNFGDLHMVDSQQNFVIGRIILDSNLDITLYTSPNSHGSGFCFSPGASNYIVESPNTDTLVFHEYDSSWSSPVDYQYQITGDTSSDFYVQLAFYNIYNDRVYVVLDQKDSDRTLCIHFDKDDLNILAEPLRDYQAVFGFGDLNTDYWIHGTSDGFVVLQENDKLALIGFNGKEDDTFGEFDKNNNVDGYDFEGNYYYVYSIEEKRLYKCHTWWK